MIIIQTGTKTTDHKTCCLKSLMNGRRLMKPSGYWFEIMNGKSPWKIIAIPPHNVERMSSIHYFMHHAFLFYFHNEIPFFIVCFKNGRQFVVALTKRRMLEQLTLTILVTFRRVIR